MKNKKLVSILLAGALIGTLLTGCGGNSSEKKKLTVWSHLKTEEIAEVDKLAKEWGEKNDVEVNVVEDKGDFQALIQAAQSNSGPDVIFGYPHDNLGTFVKAGIAGELPSGTMDDSLYTSDQIVDSVTIGGKKYAMPIALETTALFYNKDKVKEVPATMEDLVAQAKELGFKFNINDFYMSYSFIGANGGYVFKNNDGTLDPKDIGLGNEGATKGYDFLQKLVTEQKLMAPDVTGDIAKADFISGNTAFYISGPWDVQACKDAKVNFGVSPLPTLGGNKMPSFMGVQVGFVNPKSSNDDLAYKLLAYLSENSGNIAYEKGNRIPVTKKDVSSDKVKADEYINGFAKQSEVATPMPNIPEVQAMWTPANENLKLLSAGQITPAQFAEIVVKQIKEGIDQQG